MTTQKKPIAEEQTAPRPVLSTIAPTKRLKLRPHSWFLQRSVQVPAFVYQHPSLPFNPQDFSVGGGEKDYLKQKIIESRYQVSGAEDFLAHPTQPEVYAISSEPDDSRAQYYAAYLVQCYLERVPNSPRVKWLPLYKAVHDKDFFREAASCDLLVVTGLYANTIPFRLEVARDLLDAYSHVPRLVTIGGADALTMFKANLHVPAHKFAHFDSSAVRKAIEIV